MYIAYTLEEKTLVASLAPGVTPEQAAKAMNLAPGSWREITEKEAAELQKPSDEELAAQRTVVFNAAITARLNAFAAEKNWDSIENAMGQANSAVFAEDAKVAQKAYDDTWLAAMPLFPDVEDGSLSVEAALERLPALAWPKPDGD